MKETPQMRKLVHSLQEFSIPLIAGVVLAMIWANVAPHSYDFLVQTPLHQLGGIFSQATLHSHAVHSDWDHYLTLHFLINDIFMALFFGIAAKEITEARIPIISRPI